MKKMLALLLALLMVAVLPLSALADDWYSTIPAYFIRSIEGSTLDIYNSADGRALMAAGAHADIKLCFVPELTGIVEYAAANNLIYVGRSGMQLLVFFWAPAGNLILTYFPGSEEATIYVLDTGGNTTSSFINYMMNYLCTDGPMDSYYRVDMMYMKKHMDYIYGEGNW